MSELKQIPFLCPCSSFIINLCVDTALNDDGEPAMIAFHFKTKFKHHNNGQSSVIITCKRGPNNWDNVEEIDNTWIDDDGEKMLPCVLDFPTETLLTQTFMQITAAITNLHHSLPS